MSRGGIRPLSISCNDATRLLINGQGSAADAGIATAPGLTPDHSAPTGKARPAATSPEGDRTGSEARKFKSDSEFDTLLSARKEVTAEFSRSS